MSGKRFFVNKIADNKALIEGEDYNHLINVLRKKEGDSVTVFNYEHGEYLAVIEKENKREQTVEVALKEQTKQRQEKKVKITAVIALIKRENFEFVLEKLTEVGVDVIIPLITKRTIIKIKDDEKKNERWNKIIYSAVKQCGRITSPQIMPVVESVAKIEAPQDALKYFIYEKAEGKYLVDEAFKHAQDGHEAVFVIGPEGGFDSSEAETIISKGFTPVSLGDTILRAETAAIVAAGALTQIFRRSEWKD